MERDEKGLFAEGNKIAEKWTEEEAVKLGNDLLEWMMQHGERDDFGVPKFNIFKKKFIIYEKRMNSGIFTYLGIKFDRFSHLLRIADDIQEILLSEGGLNGSL